MSSSSGASPPGTFADGNINSTNNSKSGYFPRHDTPLIPELITSERPENLDAYFDFVENILDKSFRDNALVHVSLRTAKITSLEFNPNDTDDTGDVPPRGAATATTATSSAAASTASAGEEKSADKKGGKSGGSGNKKNSSPPPAAPALVVPNHFIFSPRLIVHRDGSTFGKFKVGTRVSVDKIVDCYQRVKVDTNGAVTMKVTAGNLLDSGLSLDGLVQVNLLDDAIRDEISAKASVERESVCFSMLASRDGAGTSAVKADGDVRLFNLHVGCGVEHHWGGYAPAAHHHTTAINSTHHHHGDSSNSAFNPMGMDNAGGAEDGGGGGAFADGGDDGTLNALSIGGGANPNVTALPPTSSLYIGAGCFGKGWHMAGKIFRDDGDWTEAQIVLYQNIHKLASVAAMYKVNTQEGIAETTIGVSRRFTLWGRKVVSAAKFSTSGLLSVLVEANLDAFTRIGVVTRFTPATGQRPTFGILASLQSD